MAASPRTVASWVARNLKPHLLPHLAEVRLVPCGVTDDTGGDKVLERWSVDEAPEEIAETAWQTAREHAQESGRPRFYIQTMLQDGGVAASKLFLVDEHGTGEDPSPEGQVLHAQRFGIDSMRLAADMTQRAFSSLERTNEMLRKTLDTYGEREANLTAREAALAELAAQVAAAAEGDGPDSPQMEALRIAGKLLEGDVGKALAAGAEKGMQRLLAPPPEPPPAPKAKGGRPKKVKP